MLGRGDCVDVRQRKSAKKCKFKMVVHTIELKYIWRHWGHDVECRRRLNCGSYKLEEGILGLQKGY